MPHAPYLNSLRLAILKGTAFVAAGLAVLVIAGSAAAQPADPAIADPFARRGWHLELTAHAAIETWNYNASHETLIGVSPGVTYGVRDGLVLTAAGPLYYVDQRGADAYLLGATFGVRGRVYRARRVSVFLEFDVGVSKADSITPPRGTQFNYLAAGAGGATVRPAARPAPARRPAVDPRVEQRARRLVAQSGHRGDRSAGGGAHRFLKF